MLKNFRNLESLNEYDIFNIIIREKFIGGDQDGGTASSIYSDPEPFQGLNPIQAIDGE
jgi:hypothetical protein